LLALWHLLKAESCLLVLLLVSIVEVHAALEHGDKFLRWEQVEVPENIG